MEVSEVKIKLGKTIDHLKNELAKVRTGRANVSLVEGISVEAYDGSPMLKLNELATLSAPDPNLILVSPFDKNIIEKIQSALQKHLTGSHPIIDGDDIKIPVPQLTEERRKEYVKLIHDSLESSRQAVRSIRQDAMKAVDKLFDEKGISEDEKFRRREEVEKQVKIVNEQIDQMGKSKESDLMSV